METGEGGEFTLKLLTLEIPWSEVLILTIRGGRLVPDVFILASPLV